MCVECVRESLPMLPLIVVLGLRLYFSALAFLRKLGN